MRKNIILVIFSICLSLPILAQDCDIPLRTLVTQSDSEYNSSNVAEYISNRLRSLVSNSGNMSAIDNTQFALVFNYNVVDKQIVDGMSTKIIYDITATYHIMDLKSNNIFASYTQNMKGIGNNEQKALLNTFQKINPNNPQLKNFIQNGKNKIVDFYNKNYKNIIKEAQALASTRQYDNAIYNLMMIPQCCIGYEEALSVMLDVFQQFVDQHCNENLAQARAAWISAPNREGAISASIFLSEIYPDAACYDEAMALAIEIKKKMGDEWTFTMKQWDDNVSLERQRIDTMREIGIAYALSLTGQSTKPNKEK